MWQIVQTEATLLLVEDDELLADAVRRKLERADYRVLHACTGNAALSVLDDAQPRLIILDLMLPDTTGEDLLQEIREWSNVPVIIVSAKCEEANRIQGLELGADDFISKPFSVSELTARVHAQLRRDKITQISGSNGKAAKDGGHSALSFGAIELALASRQAWVDDTPLELSATEFKLLRVLTERGGAVVSADQLLRRIWSYDGYDRHIVETNIHRLRSKIEPDPKRPKRLLTIRGFGYKLTAQ